METQSHKMAELVSLLEKYAPQDGLCSTSIKNLSTIRASSLTQRAPVVYPPGIIVGAQGKKHIYIEGKQYEYSAGNFLVVFVPMPVEIEVMEASPEKPVLAAGIYIDKNKLANLLLKMDMVEPTPNRSEGITASGIFSAPIKDSLLDATIRLLRLLDNPVEAAILSESIIDEIYFRILTEEQGGELKYLLQQRGQIQHISRAVEYIHQHLDQPVSVEELADFVNMSSSGFHKKFKEVMHLSPLQYTKSIKLNRARGLILEGKSVSEAGYMVGYNSPAQFSREYKRLFGYAPSAT